LQEALTRLIEAPGLKVATTRRPFSRAAYSVPLTAHPEANPLLFCHLGRHSASGNNQQGKRVFQPAIR
jgi:hypothetical protein